MFKAITLTYFMFYCLELHFKMFMELILYLRMCCVLFDALERAVDDYLFRFLSV